jgi:hypothetical protein
MSSQAAAPELAGARVLPSRSIPPSPVRCLVSTPQPPLSPPGKPTPHLDGLHHEGHDVGVCLELRLQRPQVVVGDDVKARHEGAFWGGVWGQHRGRWPQQGPAASRYVMAAAGPSRGSRYPPPLRARPGPHRSPRSWRGPWMRRWRSWCGPRSCQRLRGARRSRMRGGPAVRRGPGRGRRQPGRLPRARRPRATQRHSTRPNAARLPPTEQDLGLVAGHALDVVPPAPRQLARSLAALHARVHRQHLWEGAARARPRCGGCGCLRLTRAARAASRPLPPTLGAPGHPQPSIPRPHLDPGAQPLVN